jgi:hypothetical protein
MAAAKELLEDSRLVFLRYSGTVVFYAHFNATKVVPRHRADANLPTFWCVRSGVGEQVRDHLLNAASVHKRENRVSGQVEFHKLVLGFEQVAEIADDVVEDTANVDGIQIQLHLA